MFIIAEAHQVVSNIVENPAVYKEVITIIFYTLGILSILIVAMKLFVKSEVSSINTKVESLEESVMREIDMLKESDRNLKLELKDIFDILYIIKEKVIGRDDLINLIQNESNKSLDTHRATCNLRNHKA